MTMQEQHHHHHHDAKTRVVHVEAIPAGYGEYATTFRPEVVTFTEFDNVLIYRLGGATPDGVVFTGMQVDPLHASQFSAPTISPSGKVLVACDLNTVPGNINLFLHFADEAGLAFKVDPEVVNRPDTFSEKKYAA